MVRHVHSHWQAANVQQNGGQSNEDNDGDGHSRPFKALIEMCVVLSQIKKQGTLFRES